MTSRSWSLLRGVLLAMVLMAAGLAPLSAQRGPGPRGQDRAELERRVRARFGQIVKQRLGLTDQEARRLEETVMGFQQDRSRLHREEQALRERVDAMVRQGTDDSAEARRVLVRMQEIRVEEARLWGNEQERLMEVLSPVQVLRFQLLREEMGMRIQRLRGGGPPGPPGMELLPER